MEPQKLRQQEQQEQQMESPPPQLTMKAPSTAAAASAVPPPEGKVGVFDPTNPVSVAMAKLRALIGDSPEVNSAELPAHAQPTAPCGLRSGTGAMGLAELVGEELEDVEEEDVPLECLRFFKLLNRRARRYAPCLPSVIQLVSLAHSSHLTYCRSLIKQLISQLQRTACTPREGFGGMGDGTPRTVDPVTPGGTMGKNKHLLVCICLL
jgi:hypothetical protein